MRIDVIGPTANTCLSRMNTIRTVERRAKTSGQTPKACGATNQVPHLNKIARRANEAAVKNKARDLQAIETPQAMLTVYETSVYSFSLLLSRPTAGSTKMINTISPRKTERLASVCQVSST